MPVHDWTRVDAGTFHDFHLAWIAELRKSLNSGILPEDYYAMAEQVAGSVGPDVLTLQARNRNSSDVTGHGKGCATVTLAPPRVRFTLKAEDAEYLRKKRQLVIKHRSGDHIVALLELVSPENKSSRSSMRMFVEKAIAALHQGYHLSVVDLFPPTRRDPQGIHGAIWKELGETGYTQPADKPLTLVAYSADRPFTAYVEPVAVNDILPDLSLFLEPDSYVSVPLEATYLAAWAGVPKRWREVLEQ